jgi:hydrogenase maturation protein HypF
MKRIRVQVTGEVQGVGFRPFALRLARSLGLTGYVQNSAGGVLTEAEGPDRALEQYAARLRSAAPLAARITQLECEWLETAERESAPLDVPSGRPRFEIRDSLQGPAQLGLVPDLAVCPACIAELRDPDNRRYRYPFITCAGCGPRFSIASVLPYDRERTSMRAFPLCDACRREYEDAGDRRCHAQGTSCSSCGPRLVACDARAQQLAEGEQALQHAIDVLDQGGIVALKGLTGFQLLVAADRPDAVGRLRARKGRPAKPFALMVADLGRVARYVQLDLVAAHFLTSAEAPIVVLPRRAQQDADIAAAVSGDSAFHGVMLPTTPLHQLLLDARAAPLVATSGNRSTEPLCRTNAEAVERLRDVADTWLVHDREIERAMDDSVVRIAAGRALMLRRARGFAPRLLTLREPLPDVLAVGGHDKSTVAVSHGTSVLVSAHIGVLDDALTRANHAAVASQLPALLAAQPTCVATDAHPDYASSACADELCRRWSVPRVHVQHHLAHVLAVVAERDLTGALLGVAWDGSGLGTDGTLWGGEFFRLEDRTARRIAQLRPFPLLGGERAAREPRRVALGLLRETFGERGLDHEPCDAALARCEFSASELKNLRQLLRSGTGSVPCTSVGRLFDAVASLLGFCQSARFEAEAAMVLEGAALAARGAAGMTQARSASVFANALEISSEPPFQIDWRPMLRGLLSAQRAGVSPQRLALEFHLWLARSIAAVAERAGLSRCVLAGGCFQNVCLVEAAIDTLGASGRVVYVAEAFPANDGALALGQLYAAARGIELV